MCILFAEVVLANNLANTKPVRDLENLHSKDKKFIRFD